MSIRSAMDTPDNMGYIVVLLKVNGDFDIDLMKQTIQVRLFSLVTYLLWLIVDKYYTSERQNVIIFIESRTFT